MHYSITTIESCMRNLLGNTTTMEGKLSKKLSALSSYQFPSKDWTQLLLQSLIVWMVHSLDLMEKISRDFRLLSAIKIQDSGHHYCVPPWSAPSPSPSPILE